MTTGARPFRAVVYLPGHDDDGKGVPVAKIACATEEGLEQAAQRWKDEGYQVKGYEVLALDLTGLEDPPPDPVA